MLSAWIGFTLLASFMQAWRNAMQSKLGEFVDTWGVALSRFIIACPLAWLYLYLLHQFQPDALIQSIPAVQPAQSGLPSDPIFWLFTTTAALVQIIATGLMIVLFKQNNFAVGAGLAKSEALIAAVLGVAFFGTQLNTWGWFGVILGAIGVFLLSCVNGIRQLSLKTLLIGLACGLGFAITSLSVREASQYTELSFPFSAAWTLVWVLTIQTLALLSYLVIRSPQTLKRLWQHRGLTTLISVFSCIGSIGWFSAMALQSVAYVKTVGQVEIFFTMMISSWWLKQHVNRKDTLGLLLVALAAIMVMLSAA